jgi:hypothetical protein
MQVAAVFSKLCCMKDKNVNSFIALREKGGNKRMEEGDKR